MGTQVHSCCKAVAEAPDAAALDALFLPGFVVEYETLGKRRKVELMPGGEDIEVTMTNRVHYVGLMVQHYLCGGSSRGGVSSVCPCVRSSIEAGFDYRESIGSWWCSTTSAKAAAGIG